jgi:hypothetical protein
MMDVFGLCLVDATLLANTGTVPGDQDRGSRGSQESLYQRGKAGGSGDETNK